MRQKAYQYAMRFVNNNTTTTNTNSLILITTNSVFKLIQINNIHSVIINN